MGYFNHSHPFIFLLTTAFLKYPCDARKAASSFFWVSILCTAFNSWFSLISCLTSSCSLWPGMAAERELTFVTWSIICSSLGECIRESGVCWPFSVCYASLHTNYFRSSKRMLSNLVSGLSLSDTIETWINISGLSSSTGFILREAWAQRNGCCALPQCLLWTFFLLSRAGFQ